MLFRKHPLGAILIAIGAFALTFWLVYSPEREDPHLLIEKKRALADSLKGAKELLSRSHPLSALRVLKRAEPEVFAFPELENAWAHLTLEAALAIGDDRLLFSLYQYQNAMAFSNEDMALSLSRIFLLKGDLAAHKTISSAWENRPHRRAAWSLLDADALALEGRRVEALESLQRETWTGEAEAKRLLRLALLSQNEHPKISWNYLSEALKNGFSPDELHYYRAQYLKEIDYEDLAAIEIEQAIWRNGKDPLYKEELFKHHWDQRQYAAAAKCLENHLEMSSSPRLLRNAFFLSKVYRPLKLSASLLSDGSSSSSIEGRWIQLIAALKEGEEIKAQELLVNHPEMASLAPHLYKGLLQVIHYRLPHLEKTSPMEIHLPFAKGVPHPLFTYLENPPYSQELLALIESRASYRALFLAAGWREAALTLSSGEIVGEVMPTNLPHWVAYGLVEALAQNRGIDEALKFAIHQKTSPQLLLLIGELHLKAHHPKAAIEILSKLSQYPSGLGLKAVKLLTASYIEEGSYKEAKKALLGHANYLNEVPGQEQLAEIALKEGNLEEAERIYKGIIRQSSIAKSFLAAKAYERKQYRLAHELTKELLKEFPHRADLKEQLALISRENSANPL